MKALITGINGQDGAYLASFLTEKGYDVIGIARKKEPTPNLDYTLKTRKRPKFYYGDVSEPEFINHVISHERPSEIYNLAAQSHVGYSFNNPATTMQANYGGLVNIINAVKAHKVDAKIYQAGTSEMFGDSGEKKQNENTPFNPKSPYAIAKLAAHQAGVNARKEGIWVSNGILFNHESPIRGEDFVTRKVTLGAVQIHKGNEEPLMLGNLSSRRDWGYAGDFVEGMWLMLQHREPDDFVLATGEAYSVEELVTYAFDALGHEIVFNYDSISRVGYNVLTNKAVCVVDPKFYRPNDLTYLCGDYTKARTLLGWEPKVRFKQLVKMMVTEDLRRI
jgi:GDPmannose 4,6-dehydratase